MDTQTDQLADTYKMAISTLKNWKQSTFSNITQALFKFEDIIHTLDRDFEEAEGKLGYENNCIEQQKHYLSSTHERTGSDIISCTSQMLPSVMDNIERFNAFVTNSHDITMKILLAMLNDFVLYNPVTQYSDLIYNTWPESYYRNREIIHYNFIIDSEMYLNNMKHGLSRMMYVLEYCIEDLINGFHLSIENIRKNLKECD